MPGLVNNLPLPLCKKMISTKTNIVAEFYNKCWQKKSLLLQKTPSRSNIFEVAKTPAGMLVWKVWGRGNRKLKFLLIGWVSDITHNRFGNSKGQRWDWCAFLIVKAPLKQGCSAQCSPCPSQPCTLPKISSVCLCHRVPFPALAKSVLCFCARATKTPPGPPSLAPTVLPTLWVQPNHC